MVVERRAGVAVAGLYRDALALLVVLATQLRAVDGRLGALQGAGVIEHLAAQRGVVRVFELGAAALAVIGAGENLPGILDQRLERIVRVLLPADADDLDALNRRARVAGVVAFAATQLLDTCLLYTSPSPRDRG